jgi:ABC-type branched-subunit amino acid transport system substrate-binding protein
MRAVLEERPDVVVAAVTEPVAAALEPLSAEARVPLVAANVGAHAFHPAGGTTASLHAWQASYALGGWAVRNLGPRAAVAVTLREAGYDTVYAFRRGVEAAGGTMVATRVTHEQAADAGLGTLVRTMRAVRPDHVHVLATGHAAVDVFRALGDLDARVPLSAGGLSVDERVLPALGRSALGVTSVAAWRGTAGSPGGPYETLGSEAARLAIAAFRGETASAGGGLLLRRVDSGPAGPRNVTIGTIPADQDPADALAGLDVNRCAYIDEYPCP